LQLCGRVHYRATRKNLESRTQLDEPAECTSRGDPLLLHKIKDLGYCFSLWYEFFVYYALTVENKIFNMVLMRDLWNFSFFGRGDVSPTHSELCRFVSGSQAKHQVSSPVIILLKKSIGIGHRNNVLAICDSIFPLLGCQGVWNKMCTQTSLSQTICQNPKNLQSWGCSKILLSFLMQFDGHF
jgi:hypothetical protein